MAYGDTEGINRYLGLGSLGPPSYSGMSQRKHAKLSNVCWRFNGVGRCRQNCRFRHACDQCRENSLRIDYCMSAPTSQPPATQLGVNSVGVVASAAGSGRR